LATRRTAFFQRFPRWLRPEQPDLETKDWKKLLWSPSQFRCELWRWSHQILQEHIGQQEATL